MFEFNPNAISSIEFFTSPPGSPSHPYSTGEPTRPIGDCRETSSDLFFRSFFGYAPTTNGDYILSIAYNAFTLDGTTSSPAITLNYTLDIPSGVEAISTEAAEEAVYNLQGIRIDSEWSELAPGIYIRGGKKVLKK